MKLKKLLSLQIQSIIVTFLYIDAIHRCQNNDLRDKIAKSDSRKGPFDEQKIPFTDIGQYIKKEAIIHTYNITETEREDKKQYYFLN